MSRLIDRFLGPENEKLLLNEICRQVIIQGNEEVALEIVRNLELLEFDSGVEFARQGDSENDLYFVLSGRVAVVINGREMAIRGVGEHVGEMAMIDASALRIASLVTVERTVLGKISERWFTVIADRFPSLWRMIALHLGNRLRQRSQFVLQRNPRPVIFLGCSSEALSIATVVKSAIETGDCVVRLWTDNVFVASSFAIIDLEEQVRTSDFAILLLTPDDTVVSREVTEVAPRDNIIFELGLFMGAITHSRTFLLMPKGAKLKIPSDLLGLKPLLYDLNSPRESYNSLESVVDEILGVVLRLGTK